MRDAEFRAMLQASRERNKHNSYAYTNSPTSHEVPKFTRAERKGIDEVIRAITPRERYMSTRKSTQNSIKNYLANFVNRPGFPGEYFICELRLPDHRFRWKHNMNRPGNPGD